MNIEATIRSLKLYRLGIGILEGDEKIIYGHLVKNFSELLLFSDETCYVYFGKTEDKIIISYDSKMNTLYIVESLWYFFQEHFRINDGDTTTLMEWWIGISLSLKPKHIIPFMDSSHLFMLYKTPIK